MPATEASVVQVVIVNWEGATDTMACLATLYQSDYQAFRVIVVDNASRDDSVKRIVAWCGESGVTCAVVPYAGDGGLPAPPSAWANPAGIHRQLLIIASNRNLGFTGANNLAMAVARPSAADYVLLLNNDTELPPDFLTRLLATAAQVKDPALIGTKINFLSPPGKIWMAGGRITPWGEQIHVGQGARDLPGRFAGLRETEFVSGCAMLIPRAVTERIGGQDDRLFFGLDDVEYSQRAARAGFGLWVNLDLIVWHRVSASVRPRRPLQWYYLVRNTLIWRREYYSLGQNLLFCLYFGLRWPAEAVLRAARGRWRTSLGMMCGFLDFLRRHYGPCPYSWLVSRPK